MAGNKTRLLQRDQYSLWRAIEALSELVRDARHGTSGPISVIVEAIGCDDWDDVEIRLPGSPNRIDHWQVKRQSTNLSRTILEQAIKRIPAARIDDGQDIQRRFHFGLMNLVSVKLGTKTVGLRVLQQLCDDTRLDGLDPEQFVSSLNGLQQSWWTFLGEAFEETETSLLLENTRLLYIAQLNSEADIKARCRGHLKQVYDNPDEVLNALIALVNSQADGRVIFDYPLLRRHVLGCGVARTAVPEWSDLSRSYDWQNWECTGTVECDQLVATCWSDNSKSVVSVGGDPAMADIVSPALLRLAVHRQPTSQMGFESHAKWATELVRACGGTLGTGPSELGAQIESCSGDGPAVDPSSATSDQLGTTLTTKMNDIHWKLIRDDVAKWLAQQQGPWGAPINQQLSLAMHTKWIDWCEEFVAHPNIQSHFLKSVVSTASEAQRSTFRAEVRLGPKTVEMVSQGILLVLAFAVALEEGNVEVTPAAGPDTENITVGDNTAHLICLRSASRTNGEPATISVLASTLLADERGIAILAGTEIDALRLLGVVRGAAGGFHLEDTRRTGFEHDASVAPIVTFEPRISAAIEQGTSAVASVLADVVASVQSDKWDYLSKAIDAAIHGGS